MIDAGLAVATALTMIANLLTTEPAPVILTHYGTTGDGYLGQHKRRILARRQLRLARCGGQ